MSTPTSSPARRVRFSTDLASPPKDRPRKNSLVYPRVAQKKGSSDRINLDGIHWGRSRRATVSGQCPDYIVNAACAPRVFIMDAPDPQPREAMIIPTSIEDLVGEPKAADMVVVDAKLSIVAKRPGLIPAWELRTSLMPPLATPSSTSSGSSSSASSSNVTPIGEFPRQIGGPMDRD